MAYLYDNPAEQYAGRTTGRVGLGRASRGPQHPSRWTYGDPDIALRAFARGACRRAAAAGYRTDIRSVHALDGHLRRLKYRCYWCKGPFEAIDHKEPLSNGGLDMLANIVPSCRSCNSTKSDIDLGDDPDGDLDGGDYPPFPANWQRP